MLPLLEENPMMSRSKFISSLFISASLTACGSGSEAQFSGDTGDVVTKKQLVDSFVGGVTDGYRPVDISFVVDTSGSMYEEMEKLEANMESFVNAFVPLSSKLDFQVFFIGTNFDFPASVSSNPKFSHVKQNVQSFDGLKRSVDFLSHKYDSTLQPRKEAIQHLIFITDDDSLDMTSDSFKDDAKSLGYSQIHVNGFVGLTKGENSESCIIENVGSVYQDLSKDSEHSGLIQDLCTDDWNAMLDALAKSILSEVALSSFRLSKQAVDKDGFRVLVDGKLVPDYGYTYHASSNSIVFKDGYEPKSGSSIKIYYFAGR